MDDELAEELLEEELLELEELPDELLPPQALSAAAKATTHQVRGEPAPIKRFFIGRILQAWRAAVTGPLGLLRFALIRRGFYLRGQLNEVPDRKQPGNDGFMTHNA